MSPRNKANASRAELVRQRRTSRQRTQPPMTVSGSRGRVTGRATRGVYSPETVFLPVEPRKAPQGGRKPASRPARFTADSRRQGYDIAFSLGRADVRAPGLSLPQFGPRLVSALTTAGLVFLLYTMWTGAAFTVPAAEVIGNQRLEAAEVNAMLGMTGRPIFEAVPGRIEANLRTAFPDLSAVEVRVGLPNRISVEVVERMPLLGWHQDGALTWIDAEGVAFLPRGEAPALVQVAAHGSPPQVEMDPAAPLYEQVFIEPEMVRAMVTLHPYLPTGMPMIYDPKYGMGWQDPRGWSVFFGQNTVEIPMKLVIYQSIVDTLTRQGIQPVLISVEYLDAPFYK